MAPQSLECILQKQLGVALHEKSSNSTATTTVLTLPLYMPQMRSLISKRHESLTPSKGHDASTNHSFVFLKQGYSNSQLDEMYTVAYCVTMCSSSDVTETWTEVEEARCELRWEEGCVKCGLRGVKNEVCSLSGEAKGVNREVWAMRCEEWNVGCVCVRYRMWDVISE